MKFRGPLAFTLLLSASRIAGSAQPAAAPSDNLNLRFADGIVAIVEDKIITVEDVRREVTPRSPSSSATRTASRSSTKSLRSYRTA